MEEIVALILLSSALPVGLIQERHLCMHKSIKIKSQVLLYCVLLLHQNRTKVQSENSGCNEIVGIEHVTFLVLFNHSHHIFILLADA